MHTMRRVRALHGHDRSASGIKNKKKTVFTIEFLSKKIATNPDAHLPVEKK